MMKKAIAVAAALWLGSLSPSFAEYNGPATGAVSTPLTANDLTLSAASNYAVSFAVESDKSMDWHDRARLRKLLDRVADSKTATLTHADADSLMNRIGSLYKLLGHGDETIVAAMKVLQPAEYDKLGEVK